MYIVCIVDATPPLPCYLPRPNAAHPPYRSTGPPCEPAHHTPPSIYGRHHPSSYMATRLPRPLPSASECKWKRLQATRLPPLLHPIRQIYERCILQPSLHRPEYRVSPASSVRYPLHFHIVDATTTLRSIESSTTVYWKAQCQLQYCCRPCQGICE